MALPILKETYLVKTEIGPARVVRFEIPGGVTTSKEADEFVSANAALCVPPEHHGIIFDGRGPVWIYGMFIGEGYPCSWVATSDPRLGAVVTRSYREDLQRGTIFSIPDNPKKPQE